jgi:hypothetical protein
MDYDGGRMFFEKSGDLFFPGQVKVPAADHEDLFAA